MNMGTDDRTSNPDRLELEDHLVIRMRTLAEGGCEYRGNQTTIREIAGLSRRQGAWTLGMKLDIPMFKRSKDTE